MSCSLFLEQDKFSFALPYQYCHTELSSHLKLGHEVSKDAKEGLCAAGLAVLSKVRGHLGELFHRSGLQRLQRLDGRVAVLEEALWQQKHEYYIYTFNIIHHCSSKDPQILWYIL